MAAPPKSAFLATARRGRPQRFEDVIGQEHITNVLQGALERGKVSHAYLFSGPRGVGKTSTARILAKALNCEQGIGREPCNTCAACRAITAGNHIDIIEIDAASNRGIDNIRDLREAVRFSPASARTKVYIIDEVHMLTPESFNALLKTLEEPPPHSKFVLATTEEHKVPETILSRCQRFHFRRLPVVRIIDSLKKVYDTEETALDIPDAVYNYVARAARGSIRDSQSLMDQIIAFSDEQVTLEAVETLLGAVEFDALMDFVENIHQGQLGQAMQLIDEFSQRGRDMGQLARDLIETYRNLLMAQHAGQPEQLIDLPPEQLGRIRSVAKQIETDTLLQAVEVLFRTETQLRSTVEDRLVLELAIFKLAQLAESVTLRDLIARVEGWPEDEPAPTASSAGRKPAAGQPKTPPPAAQLKKKPPATPAEKEPAQAEESAPPTPEEQPAEEDSEEDLSPPEPESAEDDHGVSADSWRLLLDDLHDSRPTVGAFLTDARPLGIDRDCLTVAIPMVHQFQYQQVKKRGNADAVTNSVERVFGKPLKVKFVLREIEIQPEEKTAVNPEELIDEIKDHPQVQMIKEAFEGKIVARNVKKASPDEA